MSKKKSYQSRFLKEADIPARLGKTVYIRKEHHERIQRLVRVMTDDKVSIFSYIDNVLSSHFEDCRKEMQEQYDKKVKPLF